MPVGRRRLLSTSAMVAALSIVVTAVIGDPWAGREASGSVVGQPSPRPGQNQVSWIATSSGTPVPAVRKPPAPRGDGGEFVPDYYARWANGLPSDPSFFPIGVWMQDPTRKRNGKVNALNYKEAGINTFVGLWEFPARADSESLLSTIKSYGMHAIAGGNAGTAAEVRRAGGMSGAEVLDGYHLGDEQDMSVDPHVTPATVSAQAEAIRAADPTRPIYNNFGKAFSVYPWIGAHEKDAGLRQYCSHLDIVSSDYYASIDGYEPADMHTPNYYGKAVDHVRDLCGGHKPVWGFVETSHFTGSVSWPPYSDNGLIAPSTIEQAVWSMLAHGANGIIYFVHAFYPNWLTEDGVFDHPANLASVANVNSRIRAIGPILNAQRQPTGLDVTGADATLRADAEGRYVVAAANSGGSTTATFTVTGAAGKSVDVVGEGRSLQADAAGRWSDSFTGWGHHVYKIAL